MTTSNATAAALISLPTTIESNFFPTDTAPALLLEAHRARLKEILACKSNVKIVGIGSLSELLQMQLRLSAQKAAYRATIQWITQAELRDIFTSNPEAAESVFSEVQKLLKKEDFV